MDVSSRRAFGARPRMRGPIVLVAIFLLSILSAGQAAPAAAADEDLWSGTVTASGSYSYPFEGNTGPRTFTLEIQFAFTFVDNVGTVEVKYDSADVFIGTIPDEHACITTSIIETGGGIAPAELIPPSFADDGSGNWEARAFSEGTFQTEVTETWVAVPDTLCEPSGSRTFTRERLIGAQPLGSPAGLAHQYGHENPADSTATSLEGLSFTEAVGGHEFDLGSPWCSLDSCATVTWDLVRAGGGGDTDCADLQIVAATVRVEWQLAQVRLLSAEAALAYYLALPADQLTKVGERDLRTLVKYWTRDLRYWTKELAHWDALLEACLANSA